MVRSSPLLFGQLAIYHWFALWNEFIRFCVGFFSGLTLNPVISLQYRERAFQGQLHRWVMQSIIAITFSDKYLVICTFSWKFWFWCTFASRKSLNTPHYLSSSVTVACISRLVGVHFKASCTGEVMHFKFGFSISMMNYFSIFQD